MSVPLKFRELLISFRKATGQKPQRIIFYRYYSSLVLLSRAVCAVVPNKFFSIYRDGVSEGQFYQVLLYELDAIRKVTINPSLLHLCSLIIQLSFII